METIENICELSQGASFIQKVVGDALIICQNNDIYTKSFHLSENETINMKMEEHPFRGAKPEVKQAFIKQDEVLINLHRDVIHTRSILDTGNGLAVLETNRKNIYKKGSDRILMAVFSESLDKTSNYSPMFLLGEYLKFYKGVSEAISHFLKAFSAYDYFIELPRPNELQAFLLKSNTRESCEFLAAHSNISLPAFNNRIARFKNCLKSQYHNNDSINILYRVFNHALNQQYNDIESI